MVNASDYSDLMHIQLTKGNLWRKHHYVRSHGGSSVNGGNSVNLTFEGYNFTNTLVIKMF